MRGDDGSQCERWRRPARQVEDTLAAMVVLERPGDIRLRESAAEQRFVTALRRSIKLQGAGIEGSGLVVCALRVPVPTEPTRQLDQLAANALGRRKRPHLLRHPLEQRTREAPEDPVQ